ncbi:MAG: hypothetical protein JSV89_08965 [Spirochaetaceae bacterium]|nr:MAG: hypothetical protein JSV89_08965 [Spirochaetaceae bacterium]
MESGIGSYAALDYDRVSDSIILATRRDGIVSIYRIPTTAPGKTIRIASMTEEGGATMKRLASDNSGRIYLYDWGSNDILLVDEPNMELKTLFTDILASRAITVPGFEYSAIEDALIIGTLEYYYAIDRDTGKQETLAMNKHGADNFAIHENPDGSLLFIHSGQIFKLNPR